MIAEPAENPPLAIVDEHLVSLLTLLQQRVKHFNTVLDAADTAAAEDNEDMIAYRSAEEEAWADAAHAYCLETEYWERLNSAAFDGDDAAERIAEVWEETYCRGTSKRGRALRPVLRREGAGPLELSGPGDAGAAAAMPLSPPSPPVAAPSPPSARALPSAPFDPLAILEAVDRYDAALRVDLSMRARIPPLSESATSVLVAGFDHMMTFFTTDDAMKQRYAPGPHEVAPLRYGDDVPSYFANVGGQSTYWRKVLTIAGLRNLIRFGPIIYQQLERQQFSGNPQAYAADTGLNLMRRVTGNVVDLDTTVLRCSDGATLNVINACNKHKGLPTYTAAGDFSASAQAEEIAVHCATLALEAFSRKLKLTPQQQAARHVAVEQIARPVPFARSNTERGHAPLWHYVNAGQDSFHANVPTMDDVVGALLKAPFHCLRHWAAIHAGVFGDAPVGSASRAKLDAFFQSCVVDSCFNGKWKAIEEFGERLEKEGTIVDVLQQLQMANQHLFPAELFDSDNEARDGEIDMMTKLATGRVGRDPKTKALRRITSEDVATWVRST